MSASGNWGLREKGPAQSEFGGSRLGIGTERCLKLSSGTGGIAGVEKSRGVEESRAKLFWLLIRGLLEEGQSIFGFAVAQHRNAQVQFRLIESGFELQSTAIFLIGFFVLLLHTEGQGEVEMERIIAGL